MSSQFSKNISTMLSGHPFLTRNIRYISSRKVTKVTCTSTRRVAVQFILLHGVHALSLNKILYDILNTWKMCMIMLQCPTFKHSLNQAQTHLDNINIIYIQVELCNRTYATDSPRLYRATSAHHKAHIIHTKLNSVTNINTLISTVYSTDKSHTLSWNKMLGDVLNTYMYVL